MVLMEEMSLAAVAKRFSDEAAAWDFVEELRWHGKAVCPRCGSTDVLYLQPRSGASRTTRTGTVTYRRVWRCKTCKRQFSVLIGTIFEGSKIPLRKWLMAIYLACAGKNGVSALELQRDLDITYKSAWFMVHRIREAMANSPNPDKLFGVIVADETWIGGNPSNRHANAQTTERHHTDQTPVLTLVDKNTGEIRSQVVTDVRGATLGKVIDANVNELGSILHTDAATQYVSLGRRFVAHHSVNHEAGEYVRGDVSTNIAESHFAQLKRSLDETYHNVSKEHLNRYVQEFDFRNDTRKFSDGERATDLFRRAEGVAISDQSLIAGGPVARGTRRRPPGRPGPRQATFPWPARTSEDAG
jgi:transposase-like protein